MVRLIRGVLLLVSVITLYFSVTHTALLLDTIVRSPPPYPPADDKALQDTILAEAVQAAATQNFDEIIQRALDNDDPNLALSYLDLAELLGVTLQSDTLAYYEEEMAWDKAALRMARLCGKGVIRAEDNQSMTALGCMVAVDVIGVGDVIDIVHESSQYMDDEPVDKLILGVSIVGLGTTIATIATLGASAPVAAGVSVLKIGARTGRIGAKLTKNLSGIFMKILDMSALRKAIKQDGAWTAARQVKKGKYINKAALKEANIVVGNLGTIKTQGRGLSTTMLVLKHSDSAGDIAFYKRVTGIFGKNTDGVITLLGKRIFKLGKTATKITTKLALKIGGMIMAALLAMLGVIGSLFGNIGVWLAKRLLLRFAL